MTAPRSAAGKTKAGLRGETTNLPVAPTRKAAAPAKRRSVSTTVSTNEGKHRLFSEKVRKLRQEAKELAESASRLVARLS